MSGLGTIAEPAGRDSLDYRHRADHATLARADAWRWRGAQRQVERWLQRRRRTHRPSDHLLDDVHAAV